MLKFLTKLVLAAVVALGIGTVAQAEHAAIVGSSFTATGVSSSLRLTNKGDTLTIYINGVYSTANVIDLEREVGSPGSGAFQRVLADIAPTANTLARVSYVAETNSETLRLRMRSFTSGEPFYSLFDGRLSVPTLPRATHINQFSDFYEADTALAADTTWQYEWRPDLHTQGTGCLNTSGVQEGGFEITAGGGGTIAEDVAGCSAAVVADDAFLVSDGSAYIEYRWKADAIAGVSFGFGLNDAITVANTLALFTWDSNAVTVGGDDDSIAMGFSTDGSSTTLIQTGSVNNDVVGNNADEFTCETTVVAATYFRTGILIESSGDAFFYVNGALCAAEALAVATTARLIPYFWATSATDLTTGLEVITVDYVDQYLPRPAD